MAEKVMQFRDPSSVNSLTSGWKTEMDTWTLEGVDLSTDLYFQLLQNAPHSHMNKSSIIICDILVINLNLSVSFCKLLFK